MSKCKRVYKREDKRIMREWGIERLCVGLRDHEDYKILRVKM